MPASWTFQLCDAQGNALAELATASGRSLSFKRNTYAETSFTLSHEDGAAGFLLEALANTGVPKLRCYRKSDGASSGTLRFRGPLVSLQESAEETSLVTATFRSPFSVLLGDGNTTGRFLQTSQSYLGQDAGTQIAAGLINTANADSATGLVLGGTLTATKLRDRNYPVGTNIGQALANLTNVLDGFDFREDFVDGAGSTDATFNVLASIGADQPAARFAYGATTMANVRSLQRDSLMPQNCVFVVGGNGMTSTFQDAASVAKYGRWWAKAEYSDVVEQATLDDKARALVRPNPVKTVSFTPDVGLSNCPRPFDDYNIGDTVRLFASRSALQEDTALRVNGFTLVIDDEGFEVPEIVDPTSADEDRILRASLSAEVTDG